eukprot:scaffold134324_cov121-Phaeocystis_antarctica.AAC.1
MKSFAEMPRNTPVALPISSARRSPAVWSASYPRSSSSRCCGSIAPASAADTPKHRWSNHSAPSTNAPCRARSATVSPPASAADGSCHRAAGTSPTRSCPPADTRHTEAT